MRVVPLLPSFVTGLMILYSCGDTRTTEEGGGDVLFHVRAADSILVGEDDEVYIGNPFSLVVVPAEERTRSEIWVSDFYSNVLWRFDADGRYMSRIGSPGPGPAEFGAVNLMFMNDRETVVATDTRQQAVKWFDRQNGELVRVIRYGAGRMGWSTPIEWSGPDEVLVFPLFDRLNHSSLGLLHLESGDWVRVGPVPERHRSAVAREAGWFPAFFSYVAIGGLDRNTVLLGFGGDDSLFTYNLDRDDTGPFGTVPRLLRRGVDGDCVLLPDASLARAGCTPLFDQFSAMMGMWVLSDGRIAVVNVDQHSSGAPPTILLTGETFLTLLDPSSDSACVDLRIPGGRDARPVFTVADDELYLLDRRLTGEMSEGWLLRFEIPPMNECPVAHRSDGWLTS